MCMIDIKARPVGEDYVGEAEVIVGELAGIGIGPRHVEPAGIA